MSKTNILHGVMCIVLLSACAVSNTRKPIDIPEYDGTIEQKEGAEYDDYTITIENIDEHDGYADFVSIAFGWPSEFDDTHPIGDVIQVRCAENYDISGCESPTKSMTNTAFWFPQESNMCAMTLGDSQKKILHFHCTKR